MASFSERYGYVKPKNVIIREKISKKILNSICNCYSDIKDDRETSQIYREMQIDVACNFFFLHIDDVFDKDGILLPIIITFLKEDNIIWYKKLDLIEYTIGYLREESDELVNSLIEKLNNIFEYFNFAYRIVDDCIVEITCKEEIETIEEATKSIYSGVQVHLQTALKHLSSSQSTLDYRNSIKESISAVECCCREITGKSTLDDALKNLESKGIKINSQMKKGFENLYYYTNDKRTGIRHAFMNDENEPTADEAIFMLVSCSAFVNYITKKKDKINEEQ